MTHRQMAAGCELSVSLAPLTRGLVVTKEALAKKYPGLNEIVRLAVLEAMEVWGSKHEETCFKQRLEPIQTRVFQLTLAVAAAGGAWTILVAVKFFWR
jgi:hypothetical protein